MTIVRENLFLAAAAAGILALTAIEYPAVAQDASIINASLDPTADIGTALVGLKGDLGDAEGAVAGLTAEYLDEACGAAAWEVWYELDASGHVVADTVEASCTEG